MKNHMDSVTRNVLTLVLLLCGATIFMFSGLPMQFNTASYHLTNKTIVMLEFEDIGLTQVGTSGQLSIGFVYEIIIAIILVLSPICLLGGVWFMKLAYQFLLGIAAEHNVFGFPLSIRALFTIVCMIVFVYTLIKQFYWIDRFYEKDKRIKEKMDLTKFI